MLACLCNCDDEEASDDCDDEGATRRRKGRKAIDTLLLFIIKNKGTMEVSV